MKVYRWWSGAMENWAPGNIIAVAESPELARAIARDKLEKYFERWWVWPDEDRRAVLAKVKNDLEQEPVTLDLPCVILIEGSS